MKKLKILFIVFSLFAISAFATDFDPINPIRPTEQLRAEIIDLIGTRCPYEYDKNECRAIVLFKVNSKNEIEILKVISKNIKAEPYLRNKLDNKQVTKPPYEKEQIFLLPLRMIKES